MKLNPNNLRKVILKLIYNAKSGHIGGSFSMVEIISVLYNNYSLKTGKRDKLILSKGHAVPAIYAALNILGEINNSELETFRQINSRLQGHPDKVRLPNVVATTGSLGQGLSIAMGHAIAHKKLYKNEKVFCIIGDGEIQEGQIWESIMSAPKLKLDNLFCIIDMNGAQNDGKINEILPLDLGSSLYTKIKSFGWNVNVVDGHDETQILKCLKSFENDKPNFIIANTIKGKGVSFMENYEWHAKAPTKQEYEKAIMELDNESN